MKFKIPKIVKTLDLRRYAPEMDVELHVWVNPPRVKMVELSVLESSVTTLLEQLDGKPDDELAKTLAGEIEAIGLQMMAWYQEMWSQGPEETRWSAEEVTALVDHSRETDPRLWAWLTGMTRAMISEHRGTVKKG